MGGVGRGAMLTQPLHARAGTACQVNDHGGTGIVHQADDALRSSAAQAFFQVEDEVQAQVGA
ncbi:hypothetical protein D3C86_1829220 [compost metagenome]